MSKTHNNELDIFKKMIDAEFEQQSTTKQINNCAKMPAIKYEQLRESTAANLGIRVSVLDQEVAKVQQANNQPQEIEFFAPLEPAEHCVSGNKLITEIIDIYTQYSVLDSSSAIVVALWTMLTYCYNNWMVLPLLSIVSPQKRCGKSVLMTTLDCLCHKVISTANISSGVLSRVIDQHSPCLLIDEADTFLRDNEQLRGIINSGHTRTQAYVLRCEGNDYLVKKFSTWGPKAIAKIGLPPDTILDRSIVIELKRKLASQKTTKHSPNCQQQYISVKRKILRFVQDIKAQLQNYQPDPLQTDNDRYADNAIPLLSIANAVGIEDHARDALISITSSCTTNTDKSVQLLKDIRNIFEQHNIDRIYSADLVDALTSMQDRPWFEHKGSRPLSTNNLAQLLRPYKIYPRSIRQEDPSPKRGYLQSLFEDAWKRYLT